MPRCNLVGPRTLLAAGLCLQPGVANAQVGLVLEGIADVELWATDAESRLLARNDGDPEIGINSNLWSALQLHPAVFAYALGTFRNSALLGSNDLSGHAELTQLALRYTLSPALVTEIGKIESPLGTFAARRLSNRNPLIGVPDGYPTSYPWGVRMGGSWKRLDYRAGLVSLPAVNLRYVPAPGHRLRPVAGAGISLTPSLRIGGSATWGPYLGPAVQDVMPAGVSWPDFDQWVVALDARFGIGHLATYAELAFSGYEVPGQTDAQKGYAYYVEATYTIHPRLYVSGRVEQNNYPFVRPVDPSNWISVTTNFYNGEAGLGYRLDRHTIVKLSYRRDQWPDDPDRRIPFENGYAMAIQFSHHFDVVDLVGMR